MTNFASIKKLIIGLAVIGICLANGYDNDADSNDNDNKHHHVAKPDPVWDNDAGYQEYRKGGNYLALQFHLYDLNGTPIYNAHNGEILNGPDGKPIKNYKGEVVYVPKGFEKLWDNNGNPKYGPKTGAVLYGPHCVPLLDCWGRIIYGPCYRPVKPNTPNPHYNPNPTPVPLPPLPIAPKVDVPYVREREFPKYKPSQIRDPNPIVVVVPSPVDIKRPDWVPGRDFWVPIPVIKPPKTPKLPKVVINSIPIPRGLPGYKPIIRVIQPPSRVYPPYTIPAGDCIYLYFNNGTPIYGPHFGQLLKGPKGSPLKDENGNPVWGPAGWGDLFDSYGNPKWDDKNGVPLRGPNGQPIRLSYPNGPVVYGPKRFLKEYPGDDYKGPVVVGDGIDEENDADIFEAEIEKADDNEDDE